MRNRLIILSIIIFSLLVFGNNIFASLTNGTIDPSYHYAWGENVGFVDFADITITDSSLSGSAYGENIGWIDLSTITNTTGGVLGGYAWGENIGWVDFSKVTIGTNGIFTGGAYGENIGWITFGTGNNKVLTDWRPLSVRPTASTSGSYVGFRNNYTIPVTTSPSIKITKILKFKTTNTDVKLLQIFLNSHGFSVSKTGAGSVGHETNYFGPKTKQALINFQKANKLKPDGIVGPITRGIINQLNNKSQ